MPARFERKDKTPKMLKIDFFSGKKFKIGKDKTKKESTSHKEAFRERLLPCDLTVFRTHERKCV